MKILITGGAGFIGCKLSEFLIKEGHEVTILDNFSPQIHGKSVESLKDRLTTNGIEIIVGDVRSKDNVASALIGKQSVVHLASETGTGQSMHQVFNYAETNVLGTSNLVEQIIGGKANIECFVLSSTRAVYGEGKYVCDAHGVQLPETRISSMMKAGFFDPLCQFCEKPMKPIATDENTPTKPTSVYGITKLCQEQIALKTLQTIGVRSVALRLQNVFGPGQSLKNPYTGILSIFSNQMIEDRPIYIFEDGQESRDFIFIDDVVSAMNLALLGKNKVENVFNVGSGSMTTVMEIVEKLKGIYKSESKIIVTGEYRAGDIRHNFADTKRTKEILGFTPIHSIDEGLRKFGEWVLTQTVSENNYEESLNELRKLGLLQG